MRDRIDAAAHRAGRDPSSVDLVCVSKGVALERVGEAVAAGFGLLGENRVQEAQAKVALVPGATWHLVGHLQRNKAAQAVELFSVIQSVDSLELAERLAGLATPRALPVFLQVNVDADPTKQGFTPEALGAALPALAALGSLPLLGLMTVGRLTSNPEAARPTFAGLRALSEELRATVPSLGAGLSMGMSDDFEVAVEEGSTLVRVGRAIFGERRSG